MVTTRADYRNSLDLIDTGRGEFRDDGCGAGGPSCLACLLPRCILEEARTVSVGGAGLTEKRAERLQEIVRLGLSARECEQRWGLARRTAQRLVFEAGSGRRREPRAVVA